MWRRDDYSPTVRWMMTAISFVILMFFLAQCASLFSSPRERRDPWAEQSRERSPEWRADSAAREYQWQRENAEHCLAGTRDTNGSEMCSTPSDPIGAD